ncbi:MAG: hypothetical protein QMD66_02900 [Actinomycetota bacterium]|nr:hypothetical protein [Actinomycetota bacterium]
MSIDIIANWLNLPQVYPEKVDTVGGSTTIYLARERRGFVCPGCSPPE